MGLIQETHWFSFGECSVKVEERGPSSDSRGILLFLHGRLGAAHCWSPLLEKLARDFRCLVLHFPGCGGVNGSVAVAHRPLSLFDCVTLVKQLIHRLVSDESEVILVGHDHGGLIAQLYGAQVRGKIGGLVLINSSSLTVDCRLKLRCWGWSVRRKFHRLLKSCSWKEENYQKILEESWSNLEDRSLLFEAIGEIESSWPGVHERRYWMEQLRQIQCPSLLLWGGLDQLNLAEEGIQLWKALPNADYFEERVGHWPQLEDPEWVATKIREFIFKLGLKCRINPVQKSLLR